MEIKEKASTIAQMAAHFEGRGWGAVHLAE